VVGESQRVSGQQRLEAGAGARDLGLAARSLAGAQVERPEQPERFRLVARSDHRREPRHRTLQLTARGLDLRQVDGGGGELRQVAKRLRVVDCCSRRISRLLAP